MYPYGIYHDDSPAPGRPHSRNLPEENALVQTLRAASHACNRLLNSGAHKAHSLDCGLCSDAYHLCGFLDMMADLICSELLAVKDERTIPDRLEALAREFEEHGWPAQDPPEYPRNGPEEVRLVLALREVLTASKAVLVAHDAAEDCDCGLCHDVRILHYMAVSGHSVVEGELLWIPPNDKLSQSLLQAMQESIAKRAADGPAVADVAADLQDLPEPIVVVDRRKC